MTLLNDFSKAHIAVCDDSITNVMILSKLLQSEGYCAVHAFTDPRKLLAHVIEHWVDIDLLVLDIEMPHMTGIEITRALKAVPDKDVSFSIIILTGLQDQKTRHEALRSGANDFINKPFDQMEVMLRIQNLLRVQQTLRFQSSLAQHLEKEVQRRIVELNQAVNTLVHRMALAGEMRDNETGLHVVRVGHYSGLLAQTLGLPPELCFMIEKAAPLHDIGKIGIPDRILHKNGRLDDEERLLMNRHAEKGGELLSQHDSMLIQLAASIAVSHHEKWDGSGYPRGLSGESIPIEGRIVAVADVFDALTTSRPYKEAWPVERAFAHLLECSGSHFDPQVVEAFVSRQDEVLTVMTTLRD